eukprot:sb/3462681/
MKEREICDTLNIFFLWTSLYCIKYRLCLIALLNNKHKPPCVSFPVREFVAYEGESVTISADIVSEPKPQVIWENKSKKDLAKKNRFTQHEDRCRAELVITNLKLSDAGNYTLKAKNKLGPGSASVQLRVQPARTADGTAVTADGESDKPRVESEKGKSKPAELQPKNDKQKKTGKTEPSKQVKGALKPEAANNNKVDSNKSKLVSPNLSKPKQDSKPNDSTKKEPTKPVQPLKNSTTASTKSDPVKKTEPVKKPTEPVKKPTEPVKKPTDPVKKTETVKKPTEPVKKAEPVKKPTDPVKKAEAVKNPTGPVVEPDKPTEPANPQITNLKVEPNAVEKIPKPSTDIKPPAAPVEKTVETITKPSVETQPPVKTEPENKKEETVIPNGRGDKGHHPPGKEASKVEEPKPEKPKPPEAAEDPNTTPTPPKKHSNKRVEPVRPPPINLGTGLPPAAAVKKKESSEKQAAAALEHSMSLDDTMGNLADISPGPASAEPRDRSKSMQWTDVVTAKVFARTASKKSKKEESLKVSSSTLRSASLVALPSSLDGCVERVLKQKKLTSVLGFYVERQIAKIRPSIELLLNDSSLPDECYYSEFAIPRTPLSSQSFTFANSTETFSYNAGGDTPASLESSNSTLWNSTLDLETFENLSRSNSMVLDQPGSGSSSAQHEISDSLEQPLFLSTF